MSEKRIRDQLEGLFSDIGSEPGVEMKEESASGEATIRPTEAEMAPTQMVPDEPGAVATPAPVPAQPHEADPSIKHLARPVLGSKTSILASIELRLTILLVLAAIVPLIAVSAWSLYTLQQANRLATEQSEAVVRELGEAAISQTASATARQIELYLKMHPEIDLANLAQLEGNVDLAKIAVQPVGQTGYTAVFDNKGITHFHANPKTVGMDMSTLSEKLPKFWAIFAASLDGSPADGYYDWEDADKKIRAKYMSIAPVPGTPLRVAATTYIDEFSQPVVKIESQLADIQATTRTQLLFALVGIGLVVSAGAFVYGRRFSRPIHLMADAATRVAAGDLSPTSLEERDDEIGALARVFNSMVVQLRQTLGGLEQRVAERTHVLELAAGVGRRLSTVRDLDSLLQEAVEQIQTSFDLYHTQVYLTDPAGRYLRLQAGTGEAGAELLRRSHSLPLGPGSINGTAAAQKHAVLVSDTAQSATFLPNPLLPDTRSEMAVPLLVGDQVLGVLDLQSARPGSLTAENLLAFEALAGQLAVAIHNANLFREVAQARAEAEAETRRLAGQDWGEFLDGVERGEHMGYAYERDSLEPIAEPLVATPAAHVLAMPVQVQGAPVGSIQIEAGADRAWTQAETELVESVARQVGQQAENLRLLAQAEQYRAEAEQASRRLTREGWQAYLGAQAEPTAGFVYDLYQVKPLTDGRTGEPPALTRALEVRGEPIGELAVGQVAEVDDQATDLVTSVSERLSAHIENLRLLEETRNRGYELEEASRELEASQRVTFAASETGNPDELLDLVVNLIRDQFDLYHAQVYLVDEEREAAVLRKSTGYAGRQLLEGGHYIPLEQPALVTQAIRQGEPAVVADLGQDRSWRPDPLLPHTRSQMVVPLKAGDKVIGALDVHSRTPGRFTPRTVTLFQTMAEQVAMNFQSTDLLTRTTEQAEALTRFTNQLRSAAEITERVSAILDLESLLNEVVTLMRSRFGLYHVHIYLLDEMQRELVVRAGSGEVGRVLRERGHRIPLEREQSLVARAARTKQLVLVNDVTQALDFMPNPLLPETRSEVAVPLIASGQVLGVFDVQHNEAGHFTDADLDVFTTLAGQIATAFQNAGLFGQVERSLEETRVRFEVSQALAGAQTEEEVLDALIQQMGVYSKAQVGIDLIDPDADELTFVVRRNASFDSGLAGHEPGMRFSVTQFGLAQRFSPDTPFVSSNTQLDGRFDPPSREFARKVGHTSIAILPITTGTEWLGVIGAFSSEEGYFDETKLHLYQTLAEQGAVALRIARLYDETQRTAERLREVDRLKGEFLATMSHELRTPLNSILGYSEFLLMDLAEELEPESFEDLQSIHDNSRHLLHLINDILDLTKIEAGRLTLNFEEVEVAPLLDEVKVNNAGLLVNKPVEMTVEVEGSLPAIHADRVRLSQIMNNLVSNAVKFTEEGQVCLRAFQEDGQVCLEVQDTGVGIKSDDLDDIFDKFRQVDGSFTRRAQGTGLGLAITRHLVEMHSGNIDVRSQPGQGSTFTVRLPIDRPEAEAATVRNGNLNE